MTLNFGEVRMICIDINTLNIDYFLLLFTFFYIYLFTYLFIYLFILCTLQEAYYCDGDGIHF